jgi:hypothetical protein
MLLPFFLAIDSFLAAFAIGILPLPACRKYQICLLFGLCDGLATLVSQRLNYGATSGIFRANPWLDPISICVWLLFVGFLAYRIVANRRLGDLTLSLLPLILSIDNLLSPPFSVAHLPTALVPIAAALFSAGFGILGVTVGIVIEVRISRPFSIGIGIVLLALTPILL